MKSDGVSSTIFVEPWPSMYIPYYSLSGRRRQEKTATLDTPRTARTDGTSSARPRSSLPCVCLSHRKISYEPDAATEAVVAAMPSSVRASGKARHLGLLVNAGGADEMVEEYVGGGGLQ